MSGGGFVECKELGGVRANEGFLEMLIGFGDVVKNQG
jgi:hypothetical protein